MSSSDASWNGSKTKKVKALLGRAFIMPGCKHESLDYVGEQKTDDGVNVYRRCKNCGMLLVLTPSGKLIGVKGAVPGQPDSSKQKGPS